MLFRQYADEKQSAEVSRNISVLVADETPPADEPQETDASEQNAFEKYAAVYEQNSDFVGWISIDGANIDYPVMQIVDNPNYDLKHNCEKRYSDYGFPMCRKTVTLNFSKTVFCTATIWTMGQCLPTSTNMATRLFSRKHKTIRFDTLVDFGKYEIMATFKIVEGNSDDAYKQNSYFIVSSTIYSYGTPTY